MARAKDNDFTDSTRRKLRDRVANLCSNPECRRNTVAANLETIDNRTIIGEAAHICAASSGGPRFDNRMSTTDTKSFNNGIWLCSICHKIIDREPETYPVEMLKDWKVKAEEYASQSLGMKYRTDEDIRESQQSLLCKMPLSLINDAISNVHGSVVQTLEVLDNRLKLSTKFDNETTIYKVEPRSDSYVPTINVKDFSNESNIRKYKDLIFHGLDCEIEGDLSFLSDSILINKLLNDSSINFKKASIKRTNKVSAYLKIPYQDSNINKTVIKINGYLTHGLKTVSFIGGLKRYFKFEVIGMPMFDESITDIVQNFNMSFCFDDWNGKDIRSLDKLEDLYTLINEICDNENANIGLFTSENHTFLAKAKINNSSNNDDVKQIRWLLTYIYKAFRICENFGVRAIFDLNNSISNIDYQKVMNLYNEVFECDTYYGESIKIFSDLKLYITNKEDIKKLKSTEKFSCRIIKNDEKYLKIFDSEIEIPEKVYVVEKFNVEVYETQEQDVYNANLIANEESKLRIEYLTEENVLYEVHNLEVNK